MTINLSWRELEPGVWGASTPDGLDFVIEDVSARDSSEHAFEARQLLHTCCSSFEHRIRRFPTLTEAQSFLERVAADQAPTCRNCGDE